MEGRKSTFLFNAASVSPTDFSLVAAAMAMSATDPLPPAPALALLGTAPVFRPKTELEAKVDSETSIRVRKKWISPNTITR